MRLVPALALMALAACSTRDDTPAAVSVGDLLRERMQAMGAPEAPAFKMPSRATLESAGTSILYAAVPAAGAEAILTPVAQNAGTVTWVTADEITLTTRNGLIVATRGLGDDLMSADVSAVFPALEDGGPSRRVHYRLDGDNHTRAIRFFCDVEGEGEEVVEIAERRVPAIRIAETCRGAGERFVNRYWVSREGRIVQSRQWLTPGIGAVTTRRLVD